MFNKHLKSNPIGRTSKNPIQRSIGRHKPSKTGMPVKKTPSHKSTQK